METSEPLVEVKN